MSVLRKDRNDENLSTRDLLNNSSDRGASGVRDQDSVTPRQAYEAGRDRSREMPSRTSNPADYIPPPTTQNDSVLPARGPQPVAPRASGSVPSQVPPAESVAPVRTERSGPTLAASDTRGAGTVEHPSVGQTISHAVDQPETHPIGQVTNRQVIHSEQLWPPPSQPGKEERKQAEAQPQHVTHASPQPQNQSQDHPVHSSQTALFPEDELHNFRARWTQVQSSFVDEPRKAVESADSLVANVVKRIAEQFAAERESLENQWDRGDDVNTEDLRQALKRYRAFFDRLLSV